MFIALRFQQTEVVVTKPKKILAPTDLSQLSQPAVRYALETGLEQGAEVIVYYVVSEDGDWFGKDDPLNLKRSVGEQHSRTWRSEERENFRSEARDSGQNVLTDELPDRFEFELLRSTFESVD